MNGKMKILGIHGLGDHRTLPWKKEWSDAVKKSFPNQENVELEFEFLSYDDIFDEIDLSAWQITKAVAKLLGSGIGSLFGRRSRVFGDRLKKQLRWKAGYVVAWVENEEFQRRTRKCVLDAIKKYQPDVVLAHSLGSLVSYNALSHADATKRKLPELLRDITYVSLGSQIGNPFVVKNLTPGRITPLDVSRWYHLYNEEDGVLTSPIRLLDAENYEQVETYFNLDDWFDHAPTSYLSHPATVDRVWRPLSKIHEARDSETDDAVVQMAKKVEQRKPRKRAVLIGINDYPRESDRLQGCVNDVFLMSSVLQECEFAPDQIRICLNDRATAAGITERLRWLLDDPMPGDELVFYYSGHGAQLSSYGIGDTIDHMDETLVPYDFDWTPETCVTDDQIFGLYSQLPYDTQLAMIFDCCHSGGIHRAGSLTARGIDPPDDIRHRSMQWDKKHKMWVERKMTMINKDFSSESSVMDQFCGKNRGTYRIGRAMELRQTSDKAYKKLAKQSDKPIGPYLPMVIEACQENEYAYEYRHGVTSYGAFTYSLANILREKKSISFKQLISKAKTRLKKLNYDQKPQILGPKNLIDAKVPWVVK
ncbi:MAG: peptidase C14 [Blastopirellula sp.]|nr:MAG: peptidase C14 [Blastopirellula sp.]